MADILELCSAANEVEAHLIRAALEEAGISAQVVGGNLANTAGLGLTGEIAAPRVWVLQSDLPRAREIVEDLRSQFDDAGEDLPDNSDEEQPEDDEEETQGESLSATRAVTRFGQRFFVALAFVFFGSFFCLTARAAFRAIRDDAPIGAVIEPLVFAVFFAGLMLFLVRVWQTRLRSGIAREWRK